MTTRVPPDASLERLIGLLEAHNPNLLQLLTVNTEIDFVAATEDGLERAVRTIESGAKRYSIHDERGLSRLLADLLNMAGFHASAERDSNGHVDVTVEHTFGGRWKYLGECKIYAGFQYHVAGCEQVLGYCTGRELRVFSLDFFKVPAMFEKLATLRARMVDLRPHDHCSPSSDHRIKGAFTTPHTHGNGGTVEILHAGCAVPKG
jgi:hypothetical protein